MCVDGTCEDAWTQSYELAILQFSGCPVDGAGDPEIYFEVFLEDAEPNLIHRSAVAGCPAGWGNELFILEAFDGAFEIEFWEQDAFFDDFVTSLCWDTLGEGACGPFPKSFLHDGSWIGKFGAEDMYEAEIEINLIAP